MVKCLLCGAFQTRELLKKKGVGILQCQGCGLTFLGQRVTAPLVYEGDYFNISRSKGQALGYYDYLADKQIYDAYFTAKLDMLESFLKAGRILDIGCAFGFFLALAKGRGWGVYGIEPSVKAAKFAKENYGLNIFNGPVEKAKFKKDFFDVITLFQTLEHLADPALVLKKVCRWLKREGLVVIATPNQNSYLARVMGNYWVEYKPDEHNFYFTPETLTKLLLKTDFTDPVFARDFFPFSIHYILERALYYLNVGLGRGLINRINVGFFLKPLIPLYLGGLIVVAAKKKG